MSHSSAHLTISILLVGLIAGLLIVVASNLLAPRGKVTCASFDNHGDAQDALRNGHTQLDGDSDGTACESLKRK
jgi:hypothetical protein